MHNVCLHYIWRLISLCRSPDFNSENTNESEIPSICKPSILHPDANETPATHPKSHWLCIRLARLCNATTPVESVFVSYLKVGIKKWKTTNTRKKGDYTKHLGQNSTDFGSQFRKHFCYHFLPTWQTMPSEEFTFTTSAWSRRDRWMDWLLLVWFYCLMDGKRRFKSEQVLLMEEGKGREKWRKISQMHLMMARLRESEMSWCQEC